MNNGKASVRLIEEPRVIEIRNRSQLYDLCDRLMKHQIMNMEQIEELFDRGAKQLKDDGVAYFRYKSLSLAPQ